MARNVFFDEQLQAQFDRDGYVVIDLLNDEQVQQLLKKYDEIDGVKGTVNTNNNSYELSFFEKEDVKRKKFAAVYDFFKEHVNKHIDNYFPIIVNLFNKQEGTGEVPIHQNWTFVDETKYTSVSLWCPLQEVNHENGTLEVVPGSHKVVCDYRGPSIPWVFDELYGVLKEKYMVPLELKPGQVGIIDDSVIHYSGVNRTNKDRRAIQLILKPAEVPTIHCYKKVKESDEIEIMEVEDDYFFDFNMWEKPREGKHIETIVFPIKKLTEQELTERCNLNLAPTY